jgi:hypothetical protein
MFVTLLLSALCVLVASGPAAAEPASSQSKEDWRITVYPVLAWVPTSIDIDVDVPPSSEGGDDGVSAEIIDSRFDGAFLGGFSVAKAAWRLDAAGLWAAVGGDRVERPVLSVDVDLIYLHVSGGRKLFKDLYATAGVRRLALKYDINVDSVGNFERKPGVWDPLIGVGWHTEGQTFDLHATFEGGGFGVGTEVELAGSVRVDWRPIRHFGFTGGYQLLYFRVEDSLLNRVFKAKHTLHGPMVGVGLYF